VERFTAIILAGGASARMGRPKALLPFGEESLIERVVRRLEPLTDEIVIAKGAHVGLPPLGPVRIVDDPTPLEGPLSGILNGLRAMRTELGFVCGCDHPFLEPALVELLVERSAAVPGVAAIVDGIAQPLLATYRSSVVDVAAAMLAAGERRAVDLVRRAGLAEISQAELLRVDPSGASFVDVDTPEAYRRALEQISPGAGRSRL
jgi:molybdopterin-guanine dinucleotide biosynthesis protein A